MADEYRSAIKDILAGFSGQDRILVVPRLYIDFFQGIEPAVFFNQCLYWSDRATLEDKWFYKSYAEWWDELGLSEYQVRKTVRGPCNLFVNTKIQKVSGNPTVHYRVLWDDFQDSFLDFLRERNQSESGMEPVETPDSFITEITNKDDKQESQPTQTPLLPSVEIWQEYFTLAVDTWPKEGRFKGWTASYTNAEDWRIVHGFSPEYCLDKVYAVKAAWTEKMTKDGRSPYSTFQNYARNDWGSSKDGSGGRYGRPKSNAEKHRELEDGTPPLREVEVR